LEIEIGFSPCPNDTFIFDALVNQKIDTGELRFKPILEDVETLNRWALEEKLPITKLSLPALFRSLPNYRLFSSGSALGKGVGPLLISKGEVHPNDVSKHSIAIPGVYTTANLLMSFAFPEATNREPMLFSEIEAAVLSGKKDLGVIIHENRFTYQDRGLSKVVDLGSHWEEKMNIPIPLGSIAVHKSINEDLAKEIDALIHKSLEYSYSTYPEISDFVREHAQEMEEEVMRKHINLYVNSFSLHLGDEGRRAIEQLYKVFQHQEDVTASDAVLFL